MNNDIVKIIIEVAQYIIKNKATIDETAAYFNKSTSSIKKYINNPENLQAINKDLYLKVKEIQKEIERLGKIEGGKKGKRGRSVTRLEINNVVNQMIRDGLTFKQAEFQTGMSHSTIHDNLIQIKCNNKSEELEFLKKNNLERFGKNHR